jgi:succinate dehydrogenase/fumarate reductase-like Fe-S protein
MQVTLRVAPFDPETDERPHIEMYDVPAQPMDRVLDLLHWVKWNVDGSLTFRRSCGHGICGSDAVLINGFNRLACKTLVRDVGTRITVEALPSLRVLKDLIVDWSRSSTSTGRSFPTSSTTSRSPTPNGCSRKRSGPALMTPPSASCVRPARAPVRCS